MKCWLAAQRGCLVLHSQTQLNSFHHQSINFINFLLTAIQVELSLFIPFLWVGLFGCVAFFVAEHWRVAPPITHNNSATQTNHQPIPLRSAFTFFISFSISSIIDEMERKKESLAEGPNGLHFSSFSITILILKENCGMKRRK